MKETPSALERALTSRGLWILAVAWTLIAGGSLAWNLNLIKEHTFAEAKAQATANYYKDIEYRRWNAGHGGVYVPITEKTQPNPYLSHVPGRDVTTTSGKKLTLINPAFMTRQVHELMEGQVGGIRGHITSLMPVRPGNKADPWETNALKKFEEGESEAFSIEETEDGKKYFRYMHSMVVEQRCLKCHAAQGYQLGDIRGGVSVSVPMEDRMAGARDEMVALMYGHGILWFLGLSGIFVGGRRQVKAELAVRDAEATYRSLYESSRDAIMTLTMEEGFLSGNTATIALFGCRDEAEFTALSPAELSPEFQPDGQRSDEKAKQMMQQAMQEGSNFFQWMHRRVDGSEFSAEVLLTRMDFKGKTLLQATVRDISERKRTSDVLKQRLDELERFQAATIDREFRIKELKDEIAALKANKAEGGRNETG